jgi:hypothetical protein
MTPLASYEELVSALRERADALDISRDVIDEVAGLPDHYSSKILSLGNIKRIGIRSLWPLLGALGLKLLVVEDPAAVERLRSRYVRRNPAKVISAKARWERDPDAQPPRSARAGRDAAA